MSWRPKNWLQGSFLLRQQQEVTSTVGMCSPIIFISVSVLMSSLGIFTDICAQFCLVYLSLGMLQAKKSTWNSSIPCLSMDPNDKYSVYGRVFNISTQLIDNK
jgi:hypothetical protein